MRLPISLLVIICISCCGLLFRTTANQDIQGQLPEVVDISEQRVKQILRKQGFNRIKIIEIDYDIYQGKKVYEVDFKYRGKVYEAAISLRKQFIYAEVDLDN